MAYKEFLRDVDVPLKVETQAYIDNFVFGRDQVSRRYRAGGRTGPFPSGGYRDAPVPFSPLTSAAVVNAVT